MPRLTLSQLQIEAEKHGLQVIKTKSAYSLEYPNGLPVFNKSASSLALCKQFLDDYQILKEHGLDCSKRLDTAESYDQTEIQGILDKYCPGDWEAIAPKTDSGRFTSDLFRADRLPLILRVAKLWKTRNFADIDPQELAISAQHCKGLFQLINSHIGTYNLNSIDQLDQCLQEFYPELHKSEQWQKDKAVNNYKSVVIGATEADRVKFFNTLACKIYLRDMGDVEELFTA